MPQRLPGLTRSCSTTWCNLDDHGSSLRGRRSTTIAVIRPRLKELVARTLTKGIVTKIITIKVITIKVIIFTRMRAYAVSRALT